MKFIKKIAVYFVGSVFSKIIIFVLLPFYTSHFSPESYGNHDLSLTTVTMLVSVLFLELWTGLLRFSYEDSSEQGRYKVLTNVTVLSAMCLPVYSVFCFAIGYWQELPSIPWMIFNGLALFAVHICQFEVRVLGKTVDFLISGVISSLIQFVVSLVLVLALDAGAETILIAPALGNATAVAYIEAKYKLSAKVKRRYISKKLIREIFEFSLPLAINAIAFWGMTNINRYFARGFLESDANGYIALASKFSNLITLLVQVFALAWQESAFENSKSNERFLYYSNMLKIYLGIMIFGTGIVIILTNVVFPIFIAPEYNETQLILPIYYLSALANAISNFFGHLFNAEKKTKTLLSSTIVGAIANIALLFLLIVPLELYSVPIALTLGYGANIAMRVINFRKIGQLHIDLKQLMSGIAIVVVAFTMVYIETPLIVKCAYLIIAIVLFVVQYFKPFMNLFRKRA